MRSGTLFPLVMTFACSVSAECLGVPATETSLNTANNIRAAWEVRRLSESLAPGVDTRCYIARLAAFKAESLPASAEVISQYQNTESDAFAIQSIKETMDIFRDNQVQRIAEECEAQ